MDQTGYPRDRPEQLFTLVHLGHARIFNEDVIFSVPSSQEGGIDIKVGSSTMHMPKHCSEHHPVVQIVLFPIEHVSQDTFCCPHIMVPKVIRDTIEKARTFNDEITEDVIFSVVSSQEGGIDIEVGSSTMHMLKHCSKVKDVIFSVASSQEGGIDIKVGSITMHMQKQLSMHHPVVQMVLFAIKHESQYTFCCPHSMVPKAILDIIEKTSFFEGAPLNSSGFGEERRDSKMYALVTPQSRRAGDGGSSSTGTPQVQPRGVSSPEGSSGGRPSMPKGTIRP